MMLAPVYASEDTALRIENLTSISAVVKPVTSSIAKSVGATLEWEDFVKPEAFWSPDGKRLFVRSSIRWQRGEIKFRPANRNGIDVIYTLDADGTNLTRIASNEINNRSTPIGLSLPNSPWSPAGNKIVIDVSVPRKGGFYLLADPQGGGLKAPGTNYSDIISIVANLPAFSQQRDFIWSPDGTKAVFIMNDNEIYITDADGYNIKRLAGEVNESGINSFKWSRDGKRIAFIGKNLWVINTDGTDLRKIGECWRGTWSADDSRILCITPEEVNGRFLMHLYMINVESTNKTEIIKSDFIDNPLWSPDGTGILLKSITERGNHGIYTADPTGRNLTLIYEENRSIENAQIEAVRWSPDGNKIGFVSTDKGTTLYTTNPDGTGRTLLSSNLSWNWVNPYAWSPSGNKIVYSSRTDKGDHIFISNPDGSDRVQITGGENNRYVLSNWGGSWSPDGSRILIESIHDISAKNEIFIAKLSGYNTTQELNNLSFTEPDHTPAPQMTVTASTPEAPGVNMMTAAGILYTIYLFKKRYKKSMV